MSAWRFAAQMLVWGLSSSLDFELVFVADLLYRQLQQRVSLPFSFLFVFDQISHLGPKGLSFDPTFNMQQFALAASVLLITIFFVYGNVPSAGACGPTSVANVPGKPPLP